MKAVAAALPLLVVLAACASGPERRGPPPGPRMFVSPAGEPFRPGPGGADALAAWFAVADANHDGRLSRDELVEDARRFFKRVDVDGSGVIDARESIRYEREIAPESSGEAEPRPGDPPQAGETRRGPGRGPGGRGPGPGGSGAGPGGGPGGGVDRTALTGAAPFGVTGEPQPIRAADQDLSQTVTLAEFEAHAARHFVRLDTDRNGALTQAELAAQVRPSAGMPPGGRQRAGGGPR